MLDFPDGPVVKSVLLMQGARVWSLIWELRSYMPWYVAKKFKKKIFFLKEMSCQLYLKMKNILRCLNVYKYHDGVAFMTPVLRRAPCLVYCFAVAILKFLRIYLKKLLILHWVPQIMVPVLCSNYLTWTFSINPHRDMAVSIPPRNLRV